MILIKNELRKIIRNRWVLALLLFFIILNSIQSYMAYNYSYQATLTENEKKPYNMLYQQISGNMTDEKLKFLIAENLRLEGLVSNRTYSTEYDENTYTGYVYGDYSMIHFHFYLPIKRLYEYRLKANEIALAAEENQSFFHDSSNIYQERYNKKISESFKNRNILIYEDLTGAECLINNPIFSLCVIMLLCLAGIHLWITERETGMMDLIQTSVQGRKRIIVAKLCAYQIMCIGMMIVVSFIEFIVIVELFGDRYLSMPVYALEDYAETGLICSIFNFFVISRSMILLGMTEVLLMISMVSLKTEKSILAFIKLSFIFFIMYVLDKCNISFFAYINPFTLFKNTQLFQHCEYVNLMNYPVNKITVIISVQVIFVIGLYSVMIFGKRFGYDKK